DGEHVVHQVELGDPIGLFRAPHLADHVSRSLKPKSAAEEIVGRAEGTGKWTSPSQFQGNVLTRFHVGIEMERRKRQGIKVQDERRTGASNNLISAAESHAGNFRAAARTGQR